MRTIFLLLGLLQTLNFSAAGGDIHIKSTSGVSFTLYVCNIQYNLSPATHLTVITENDQALPGKIVMNNSNGYTFYITLEPRPNVKANYVIEKLMEHVGMSDSGYQIRFVNYDAVERHREDWREQKEMDEHREHNDHDRGRLRYFGEDDFKNYVAAIRAETFDSKRVTVGEAGLNLRLISVQQVLTILKLFEFDSYRLQYAKFAWAHLADPENNYLMNGGFEFSSYGNDYQEYCKSH